METLEAIIRAFRLFSCACRGVQGVVPLSVPVVPVEGPVVLEGLHLLVGDLHSGGVLGRVEFGVHGQPGVGGGRGDGVHDDVVAGQRPAAPVHRDMGEQAVVGVDQQRRARIAPGRSLLAALRTRHAPSNATGSPLVSCRWQRAVGPRVGDTSSTVPVAGDRHPGW